MYSHIKPSNVGCSQLLKKNVCTLLADSWSSRVAVKTGKLDIENYYDPSIPDYPPDLVPFAEDSRYQVLSAAIQQKILAGAWVVYNEKTIDIETSVVAPACELLLKGAFKGLDTSAAKRVIAQTLVDEQFHILMCLDASLMTRKMHSIEELQIPESLTVKELRKAKEAADGNRNADIIQLAFATVAEVTINAYLDLLASNNEIQPFNRETTNLHRKDESAHNKIFREVLKDIYKNFYENEKEIFITGLGQGLSSFIKVDLSAWQAILLFLEVKGVNDIVDSYIRKIGNKKMVRDYSGFRDLLSELGIDEKNFDCEFDPK